MKLTRTVFVRTNRRRFLTTCLATLALCPAFLPSTSLAQGGNQYKARLAPAPPLGLRGERGTDRPTPASYVAGIGSASATLSGRKLTVTGSFEKMASAPTVAKVGVGLATGARLDLVYDLTVTKAPQATPPGTSGTIAGSVELTPAHVEALKEGKLYIQINSESAPNGHLLGWLLK
jgi:CHRD domain